MLQKVLQAILRRYFGQYLTGLENVQLAFWTGKINIQNASFKHEKINQLIKTLNLPFSIKFSYIGSLQIDIPWNKLSSSSVQIVISDIFIVFKLNQISLGKKGDNLQDNAKLLLIKNYTEYLIKKSLEINIDSSNQSGYLNKLLIKILHNVNIKVKNISVRIQNQGYTSKKQVAKQQLSKKQSMDQQLPKKQSTRQQLSKKQSTKQLSQKQSTKQQLPQNIKRRQSQLSNMSSKSKKKQSIPFKVSDKAFALGFCIENFIAFTVGENGQRKFINVDSQEAKFSKMIQLQQISLYWEDQTQNQLFAKTTEQKITFLKNLITRKQHRLLTIDGNVLLRKNFVEDEFEMNENKNLFTYHLSSQFKQLSIGANYQQVQQMLLIYQTIKSQNEKSSILRLKQLQQKQQLRQEQKFKSSFTSQLYPQKFIISCQSQSCAQIITLLNGVDKKLLMKWTKQSLIQIIKKQKQQNRLKQKNKKGWFSFLSTQQTQIQLDSLDLQKIQQDIQNLIQLTQLQPKLSFAIILKVDKLLLKMAYQSKNKQIKQEILIFFNEIVVKYMKFEEQQIFNLRVDSLGCQYLDYIDKQQTYILELKNKQLAQKSEFQQPCYTNNQGLSLYYMKQKNCQKVKFCLQPLVLRHQIKVLSFLSMMLKLRHNNQQLKSDLIIFKTSVQSSMPNQQLQLATTNYQIDVVLKKISLLVEISQNEYLKAYVQSIFMTKDVNENPLQINHLKHKMQLSNLGVKYIKNPLKLNYNNEQSILQRDNIIDIISDVSLSVQAVGLNKISSQINQFCVNICQEDLGNIYSCLKKQTQVFSYRKTQFKKQKIIDQVYLQGKVDIINIFRVKKSFLAVLYFQSLALYSLRNNIQSFEELLLMQNQVKPHLIISLAKLRVFKFSPKQLKFQSLLVNQVIQFQDPQNADTWLSSINCRIFQFRAKSQMYNLIDEQQNMQKAQSKNQKPNKSKILYQYDTEIQIKVKYLNILYCRNNDFKIAKIQSKNLILTLKQNNFSYHREINIEKIQILNCQCPPNNKFGRLLSNNILSFDVQFPQSLSNNIIVTLSGKKKLHPQYTGELSIAASINHVIINFDTQFIFMIINKLVWQYETYQPYTEEQRDNIVLQMILKKLLNQETKQLEDKIAKSKPMENSDDYIDIDRFKKLFTCLVLLAIQINVKQLSLNLINGRSNHVMFNAQVKQAIVNIDKGSNFFFIKVKGKALQIDDVTGYPFTTKQKWSQKPHYNLVSTNKNRINPNAVQFYYSSFPQQSFINKNRFRSFIYIKAWDLVVNYQHQPIMRFVDFLVNQLIIFFMEPHSLHKFDQQVRGQFGYDKFYYRTDQIEDYINSICLPFFNQLTIKASNLTAYFNTFPNQQAIPFEIQKVSIQTQNVLNSKRISFSMSNLIQMQKKSPIFNKLCELQEFQNKILKQNWSSRLLIKASGMSTPIMKQSFQFQMLFQRCLHQQKQWLLPCIKLQKDFVQQALIQNLSILAPKPTYNLINKCFMFNLSYDDQLDCQFVTNFQHQHKVPSNQMVFKITVGELTILIPEVNQTVVIIQELVYKFIRYPDMLKEMSVTGRSFHILGHKNFIVPYQSKQEKGLQYIIEMKQNGQKKMSTFFRSTQIIYDLEVFNNLLQYFLLDETCYPPQSSFPDLPKISCHFYCLQSYIRISKTATHYYTLNGDIAFTWIRQKQIHSQLYRNNKNLFPIGKEGSLYIAKLKDCHLRKFQKKNYENNRLSNYRVLSHPINIDMNWSNLMKMSPTGHVYNDFIVDYDIKNLFLKLSYIDIEDLKSAFIKKKDQNQVQQAPQPALPYVQYVQHIFDIKKLTIQLGISQLPVPLLDVSFEGKSTIDLINETSSINLQITNLTSKYWNMLIGRWQPIIQKLSAHSNFKISSQGIYVIFDAPNLVYLDISMDSLKVLNLISSDFSNKGNLNLFKKDELADGLNISPYVITNRTGFTLFVNNSVILPTKILDGEKMHLQTQFLQNINQFMGTISIRFDGSQQQYEIDLNISTITKLRIKFKSIEYDLYLRPVSSPIVKQIIVASPYVLSNKTCHKLEINVHNRTYNLNASQKVALPFYQIIQTKQFRLQFPHLRKSIENYPFHYKDLLNGYQHYINLQGQQFNCSLGLKFQNLLKQGEIQIEVTPVYYFSNLLPLDIFIEFNVTSDHTDKLIPLRLQVNQTKQIYELNMIEDVSMRLKIKAFHFSQFTSLSKALDSTFVPKDIILHDHRALDGRIKIKVIQQGKMRKVYLYSDALLINQTNLDLYTFYQSKLISGQKVNKIIESSTKYTFFSPQQHKFLNFGFNQEDPFRSNEFDINQLGNQELSMQKSGSLYQIIINNTLECLDSEAQIYCNVLKVFPKYVMINQSSRIIQLKQIRTDKVTHILPLQRNSWIWSVNAQKHHFCFKPIDNQIQTTRQMNWNFSAELDIDDLEDTIIVIRTHDSKISFKLLVKLEIHKQNLQTFVVFKDCVHQLIHDNQKEDFYTLNNQLQLARVMFYQQPTQLQVQDEQYNTAKSFTANAGQNVLFGWQNPQSPQLLTLKIQFLGPLRSKFKSCSFTIPTLQKTLIEKQISNELQSLQIEFVVEIIGLKKKIRIRQKNQNQNQSELMGGIGGNKIGISLHQLGISIISSSKNRKQLLYMSLKKFQVILMEEKQIRKIQVKIKYISIDNNSNHNTLYPVLLTPLKHQKIMTKSRPFFVMLIQTTISQDNITQIKQFRMCLQSISLKIHDQVLVQLHNMYKDVVLQDIMKNNSDLNSIFRSYAQKYQWQQRQLKKLENQIFFRQFQIAKLSIQISFSISPKITQGNYLIFTILSSFGVAISNISQSQLTLSRFLKKQVTLSQLLNDLSQFYVKQFIKGVYKILGSITIFGNPYVFTRLLAQGAWQIVNQPTQGFIKGPIQGTIGIAKGGIYFTRNVVAGTFNSFQAISQSLSRGISFMTMDQKFIERREKIKNQKSNHLFQGFANGMFAFYTGFEVAITGLVRHPMEGYKKDGIGAGITGALKGVAGLVTKPISGVFQGVSKISQGIKNTALLFQDGPSTKRSRHPRIFISHQKYYTSYNHLQSYTIAFLQHLSTKYLNIQILFISVTQNIEQNIMKSLLLTNRYLLIVDLVGKIVETEVGLGDIQSIQIVDDTMVRIVTKMDQEIQIEEQTNKCQQLIQAFRTFKHFS